MAGIQGDGVIREEANKAATTRRDDDIEDSGHVVKFRHYILLIHCSECNCDERCIIPLFYELLAEIMILLTTENITDIIITILMNKYWSKKNR